MPMEFDDAPAMNCPDARAGLPTFVCGGGMGVTEMALVAAQASLEQMVTSSRQRTASPRTVPQSFGKTIDAIRSGATFAARLVSLVGLAARRLGRPAGFVTRAVGTSASV